MKQSRNRFQAVLSLMAVASGLMGGKVQAQTGSITSLAGDIDAFGTGATPGTPVALYQFQKGRNDGDFDVSLGNWCQQTTFSWEHRLAIPPGSQVTAAKLTIVSFDLEDGGAGDGRGGGPFDTRLFLDGQEVAGAWDDSYFPDVDVYTPVVPTVTSFELDPNVLTQLNDGVVNVMVNAAGGTQSDCISLDHAQLDVQFEAIDQTPPSIECGASPATLWPPNHKLVPVSVNVRVTDGESGSAGFVLSSVASSEPDNGVGDGDTANDIQEFVVGTADTSGLLRAERAAGGPGRTYTLTYIGFDVAGNTSSCTTKLTVPHNR
jgi:hypothetical protein